MKPKKKDPHKVDKKFLWPHGIAPPMKNARKRRFRKTLKKKYVEAPEIEKEVRRLLREDNEAASVRWELITEEDENKIKAASEAGLGEGAAMTVPLATGTFISNQSRGLGNLHFIIIIIRNYNIIVYIIIVSRWFNKSK